MSLDYAIPNNVRIEEETTVTANSTYTILDTEEKHGEVTKGWFSECIVVMNDPEMELHIVLDDIELVYESPEGVFTVPTSANPTRLGLAGQEKSHIQCHLYDTTNGFYGLTIKVNPVWRFNKRLHIFVKEKSGSNKTITRCRAIYFIDNEQS